MCGFDVRVVQPLAVRWARLRGPAAAAGPLGGPPCGHVTRCLALGARPLTRVCSTATAVAAKPVVPAMRRGEATSMEVTSAVIFYCICSGGMLVVRAACQRTE